MNATNNGCVTVTGALKLTASEWECIRHRLGAADAITDVMVEEGYHPDDVEAVIDHLIADKLEAASAVNPWLAKAVLADCVEGSTWIASIDVPNQKSVYLKSLRIGQSVAEKVSAFVGRRVFIQD